MTPVTAFLRAKTTICILAALVSLGVSNASAKTTPEDFMHAILSTEEPAQPQETNEDAPKCKYTKYCKTNWKCFNGTKWRCAKKNGNPTTNPGNGRNRGNNKTVWGFGAAKVQQGNIPYARKYAKQYAAADARSKCNMRNNPKRISGWEFSYQEHRIPGRCEEYKGIEICEPDVEWAMAHADAKFRCR